MKLVPGQDATSFFVDTSLERALRPILHSAMDATNAQFGNVQISVPETCALRIVVQRGFKRPFLEFFRIVANEATSACGAALQNGQRVVVHNVESSRLYDDSSRRAMLNAGALACQSTPIVIRGQGVVGVLSTHFDRPHRCSPRQLGRVDALVREAAMLMARCPTRSTSTDVTIRREELRDQSPKTRIIRGG